MRRAPVTNNQRAIVSHLELAAAVASSDERPRLARQLLGLVETVKAQPRERPFREDLYGKTFGTWFVGSYVSPGKASPVWLCSCVATKCMATRKIMASRLKHQPPKCEECVAAGRVQKRARRKAASAP